MLNTSEEGMQKYLIMAALLLVSGILFCLFETGMLTAEALHEITNLHDFIVGLLSQ